MSKTKRLGLPLMQSEQALKHITHNEALALLDAVVQLRLSAVDKAVPPGDPQIGETFGVGGGAAGAFSGHEGEIATWTQGGWRFAAPQEGWLAWDLEQGNALVYRGDGWQALTDGVGGVGIGTLADATNRLAVRSEAALFAAVPQAEGGNGNVRLTINKEDADDSATVIFQSGWSGRAEIGLAGSDDFAFKVSADGTAFSTAMTLAAATGFVTFGAMAGSAVSFPTISAGILSVQTSYAVPAPESGTSDEVTTIAGGFDGALLVLTGTSGRSITLRSGVGNLKLGADRTLSNFDDSLMLIRRGSDWIQLAFSDNG